MAHTKKTNVNQRQKIPSTKDKCHQFDLQWQNTKRITVSYRWHPQSDWKYKTPSKMIDFMDSTSMNEWADESTLAMALSLFKNRESNIHGYGAWIYYVVAHNVNHNQLRQMEHNIIVVLSHNFIGWSRYFILWVGIINILGQIYYGVTEEPKPVLLDHPLLWFAHMSYEHIKQHRREIKKLIAEPYQHLKNVNLLCVHKCINVIAEWSGEIPCKMHIDKFILLGQLFHRWRADTKQPQNVTTFMETTRNNDSYVLGLLELHKDKWCIDRGRYHQLYWIWMEASRRLGFTKSHNTDPIIENSQDCQNVLSNYRVAYYLDSTWNENDKVKCVKLNVKGKLDKCMFEDNVIYSPNEQNKQLNLDFKKAVRKVNDNRRSAFGNYQFRECELGSYFERVHIDWIFRALFALFEDQSLKLLILMAMALIQRGLISRHGKKKTRSHYTSWLFVITLCSFNIQNMQNIYRDLDYDWQINWHEYYVIMSFVRMVMNKETDDDTLCEYKYFCGFLRNWRHHKNLNYNFGFKLYLFFKSLYGDNGPCYLNNFENVFGEQILPCGEFVRFVEEIESREIDQSVQHCPVNLWQVRPLNDKDQTTPNNNEDDDEDDDGKQEEKDDIMTTTTTPNNNDDDGKQEEKADQTMVPRLNYNVPLKFNYAASVMTTTETEWEATTTVASNYEFHGPAYQDIAPTVINQGIILPSQINTSNDSDNSIHRPLVDDSLAFDLAGIHSFLLTPTKNNDDGIPSWAEPKLNYEYENRNSTYYECMEIYYHHDQYLYQRPNNVNVWNEVLGHEKRYAVQQVDNHSFHTNNGLWTNRSLAIGTLVNKGILQELALSPWCNYQEDNYCTVLIWSVANCHDYAADMCPLRQYPAHFKRNMIAEIMALGQVSLKHVMKVVGNGVLMDKKCIMMKEENVETRIMSSHLQFMQSVHVCCFFYHTFRLVCLQFGVFGFFYHTF